MTRIFPIIVRRVVESGGPAGFTDDFSLSIRFDEAGNVVPTDAVSVAFQFDEAANEVPTDAASLAFTLDEAANVVPTDDSAFVLNLLQGDSTVVPTDDATYQVALLLADINADLVEAVSLGISGTDFADSTVAPTDGQVFTLRNWLSASAQTAGVVTNPANANGQNNGTVASMTTAALGTNPVMTSTCGATLPSASVVSAIYRGWFNAAITLATSHCIITAHSTTGAFADFNLMDVTASVNHLAGTFTFDLIAAGVNTLAKLQTLQILHKSTDAVAGVTPAVFTVDAGCIELAAAF